LLVENHRAFREALALAIDCEADFSCRGTSSTVAEAVSAAETARPDLVLIDVFLPDGDGIDAIPLLRDRIPHALFVVLTGYADIEVLTRAMSAGATGFLAKETPMGAVLAAIRAARDGRMLVDGSTLAAILGRDRPPAAGRHQAAAIETGLTSREQNVLWLMREGLDPHAIAARLGISLHTCRGYEKSILAKLSAHSQLEAVVTAARLGIVEALDH
jgi:DNA-binding NarL/FixJ family response regulator